MIEKAHVRRFYLVLMLGMLFWLLLVGRLSDRLRDTQYGPQATALWITYVCMLAGSLVNNLLSFTAYLFLYWGSVAVCACEAESKEEDK